MQRTVSVSLRKHVATFFFFKCTQRCWKLLKTGKEAFRTVLIIFERIDFNILQGDHERRYKMAEMEPLMAVLTVTLQCDRLQLTANQLRPQRSKVEVKGKCKHAAI